jgi:uncharacterized protein (DUF1501 family)
MPRGDLPDDYVAIFRDPEIARRSRFAVRRRFHFPRREARSDTREFANMKRPTQTQKEMTRRDLFRRAACAAVSSVAIASTVRDLRLMNAAVADAGVGDGTYKALICLFLFGGNDANNFLIPYDPVVSTEYPAYAAIRGALAIPQPSLLQINPGNTSGRVFGLHPSCTELQPIFNGGRCALVANVGTLLFPLTRTEYFGNTKPKPPQLFSHNDQVDQWQTSIPDRDSRAGWGGRMADLLNDTYNSTANVSMSISIAGSNHFEVGNVVNEYNIGTGGPTGLSTSSSNGNESTNLNAYIANIHNAVVPSSPSAPQYNLYEQGYAEASKRAVDNFVALNAAITPTSGTFFDTPFPSSLTGGSSLARQLKMVARVIAARKALGHNRQIFFVSVGGFDLHDTQVVTGTPTSGAHANLLRDVSRCIGAFDSAMTMLRNLTPAQDPTGNIKLGSADRVVGFTGSDFGRTFPVNGNVGSDHGWGNHHIVWGDDVIGTNLYGRFPVHTIKGPDDTDTGRWIPAVSVDQYAATLAKWYGVPTGSLGTIFPNLSHFTPADLGFMGAGLPAGVPSAKPSSPIILTTGGTTTTTPPPSFTKKPEKPKPTARPPSRK